MVADKLLAEWFWVDRWMGSSAFGLPMEARGVYREMLSQAWRRGARLPNDHGAIQRLIGATAKEWSRAWPLIERFWVVDAGYLVNDTQREVYADAKARQERASDRGLRGAQARHGHNGSAAQVDAQAPAQAVHKDKPPSLSPISDLRSPSLEPGVLPRGASVLAGTLPRDFAHIGWISKRGKDVPMFLHQEFCRAVDSAQPDRADRRLKVFYEAVEAGWPPGPIGDEPIKLWRREFAAKFPSVAPVSHASKSAGNDASLARFVEKHR